MVVRKYDRVDVQLGGTMNRYGNHQPETRKLVLDLFDQGELNARQIATKVNKLHKHILPQPLTRMSCLGMKWRAGKSKPRGITYVYKKPRRERGYIKSLAFNEHEDRKSYFEMSKERLTTALKG